MNIMDRETILKHSKAIRLQHTVLSDFTDVMAEYCAIKGHPEYLSVIIQLLQQPIIGEQIINAVLEYFEREYKLIKLEKINICSQFVHNLRSHTLLNEKLRFVHNFGRKKFTKIANKFPVST